MLSLPDSLCSFDNRKVISEKMHVPSVRIWTLWSMAAEHFPFEFKTGLNQNCWLNIHSKLLFNVFSSGTPSLCLHVSKLTSLSPKILKDRKKRIKIKCGAYFPSTALTNLNGKPSWLSDHSIRNLRSGRRSRLMRKISSNPRLFLTGSATYSVNCGWPTIGGKSTILNQIEYTLILKFFCIQYWKQKNGNLKLRVGCFSIGRGHLRWSECRREATGGNRTWLDCKCTLEHLYK